MHPKFGIERERNNNLFFKSYTNDKGIFQFHSQIELYFVDEGEMEVAVNDSHRILKGGELSVALSYNAHAYKTPVSSKSSVLIIPPHICPEFISATKHKNVTNPFITDREAVAKIKEHYNEVIKCENKITLLGHVYVILGLVMDSISFEETDKNIEPELSSRILFYINENFKKDISLLSISSALGYSQSYISRYFKSCFNIGINRYINIVRLKNAITLMHEHKYNITFCALESGFNSMRTFYRAFFDEFQCSPKDYMSNIDK